MSDTINMRSVAQRERKNGNTELAGLIEFWAAEIERLRAALREAAVFLETAAPFLPDDVAVKHSFNNGETLQTRPLSVVLRACAKDARRALEPPTERGKR